MKSALFTTLRRSSVALAALAMAAIVIPAHADNLVLNGDFETVTVNNTVTTGVNSQFGSGYNSGSVQEANWSTSGYNFVYSSPSVATSTGAAGASGNVALWSATASPTGGNFIAADGNYEVGAISQTINGLTVGAQYDLSFEFGGAQQAGFDGVTTEQYDVTFGTGPGQGVFNTQVLTDQSHGFTGWQSENVVFTANSTSEVLSFLAVGTPDGVPPMSLLDGVSLTATPEPSSLALMATGLFGVGGLLRSRFRKNVA